jgi:hypothetical protein
MASSTRAASESGYGLDLSEAMKQVVARAWVDSAFKAQLLTDPHRAVAELGVHRPDHCIIEFYEDPAARIGDWSSVGTGQRATLRIPIPAPPVVGRRVPG